MRDMLRKCVFRPYRKGYGPTFTLLLWDTHRWCHNRPTTWLGYKLIMSGETLFEGEDFSNSPFDAVDSDETVKGLMGFLTLRPGDTDPDYFDGYNEKKLEYCDNHAEDLMCCVYDRFGWED